MFRTNNLDDGTDGEILARSSSETAFTGNFSIFSGIDDNGIEILGPRKRVTTGTTFSRTKSK
ncbi:MAG: hypothetical protein K2X93_00205 [Candidatus Obscuribacterales bacterium]|nr:hypothetical protein [Candidatus Obscuribacterales bacterium]